MNFEFRVDIEDGSGNKLGSGPLASVGRWKYTARMDRAGTIAFDYAANDPQADIVTNRRVARAHALLNGEWVEVGAGVIDNIETSPSNDGRVSLNASGLDLIRELAYRTVGTLEVGSGSGATHSVALTAIGALAPSGWTFTPAASPDNDYIYARYGGESVLGALVQLAEKTQTHFYRSINRTLVFVSDFEDSGVRAIQARGYLRPETCAIVSLRRTVDTNDLLTRIHPYGSGQGVARLTLAATNRTAPSGYYLNKAANYIENTTATLAYGLVSYPEIEFKEITPISNTDADLQAAANMLFDAALEELTRRSTLPDQETYALEVAGCSQLLRPMQTIRLVYRDTAQGIDIDENLFILEATWEIDESGIRTSQLVVSTQDRWPDSDESAAAERAVQGRTFTAHPQLNANSYVVAYNKNVDADNNATFRFRFGSEVVNLQQVLFEFQLLPFESTIRNIIAPAVTSGSGGSQTPTSSGDTSHTHTVTIPNHTHSVTILDHNHTVTIPDHTHTVTIANHTHTVTIAAHTHNVTIDDHTHGVTLPNHTHDVTIDDHSHSVAILDTSTPGSPSMEPLFFDITNDLFAIGVAGTDNFDYAGTTEDGGSSTPTTSNGGALVTSTASGGGSTPTTSSGGSQTPTSSSGGGSTPTTSSGGSSTPTTSDGGGSTPTTSSGGGTTPTSSGGSEHTHTVTIADHTHDVTPVLTTVYGIFRQNDDLTYTVDDLEYRINGGDWVDLDTATDAGDSWYALDITDDVYDNATFRPLQTNNTLEIQAKTNTLSIASWTYGGVADTVTVTTTINHNYPDALIGYQVEIENAKIGSLNGDINGTRNVVSLPAVNKVTISVPGINSADSASDAIGTITALLTATIDAQLSVRNTIQAISYT